MFRKVWRHHDPYIEYQDYSCPKKRYWFYKKDDYDPGFRWMPRQGGDEWCRLCLVLPVPFKGWVIIALWECRDNACEACEYDCERI